MTVQVNPGPGVSSWSVIGYTAGQSSVWTVSVNGTPSFVYSYSRTSPITTDGWSPGATVTQAWTQFGADETTTLTVTRTGGITSAVVYPTGAATFAIDAGILTINCPIDVDLIVEVNGDRRDTLLIFADQLKAAVPVGAAHWSVVGQKIASAADPGTNRFTFPTAHGFSANERVSLLTTGTLPTAVGGDLATLTYYYVRVVDTTNIELARTAGGPAIDLTSAGTGTHTVYRTSWGGTPLYFSAGVWDIGLLFYVASGATLYLDAGAVVRGNVDVRHLSGEANGITTMGPGVLSAATTTNEAVFALSNFFDRVIYSAFVGYSGGSGGFWHNTEVRDITIVATPYYTSFEGVNRWTRTKLVAPWTWSCDGFRFSYRSFVDTSASCTDCFAYVADDVLYLDDYFASLVATGNFLATTQNAIIHSTYWPDPDTSSSQLIEGNDLLHYGIADVNADVPIFPTRGGNAVFKAWTDGFVSEESEGSFDVILRNNRVHGPVRSRLFSFANKQYPYGDLGDLTRDRRGEVSRWTIDGLIVDQVPGQPSIIEGFDQHNTPHDIAFFDWTIAGTTVTAANFDTYVVRNDFPFNLYVDGVPVADVFTTTGSWFAASPASSPWSFLPAIGRLGGSRSLRLPEDVAWPGTPTASRGVLPSIGGYDWGATSDQTGASLSATVTPSHSLDAASTVTASLAATVTPSHSLASAVASTAELAATVTPSHALAGSPIATAALASTVTPEHSLAAASSVSAALSVADTWQHTATADVASQASVSVGIEIGMSIAAAPTIEASQTTAEMGPTITIAATAEALGEVAAYLEASVVPTFTIAAATEGAATMSATLPLLGAEIAAEALIGAATEASVDPQWQIEAEALTPPDLIASLSATVSPSFEVAAEALSAATLAATVEPEHVIEAEIAGTYNLRTAELDVIRTALLGMMGRSAATAGAVVQYEAEPQGPPPSANATLIRGVMLPVTRQLIGHDGEPLIQQDGRLQLQVLFPRGTGTAAQTLRLLAIVRRFPAQTVVASVGVTLTGGAEVRRIGQENGRTRWDVTIPWRTMRVETSVSDTERVATLQTVEGALEAMRTIWSTRIEDAVPGEGWAGLRTYYDDVGPFDVPPPVPWAGVWTDAFGTSSREASSPTETVLGQVLVQIHTDKSLGTAGATRIVNRIATEHNRQFRSVVVGVATVTGSRVTPAGTWQTTMRIPFRFDRARD